MYFYILYDLYNKSHNIQFSTSIIRNPFFSALSLNFTAPHTTNSTISNKK